MIPTRARVRRLSGLATTSAIRLGRQFGWGVADQALSSITNFAIGIVITRLLGTEALGAFALAFTTYAVGLNISRGLASDPLVIRYAGEESAAWRRATTEATGTALVIGLLGGVACALFGALLAQAFRSSIGSVFVALGIVLPGLLLQDAWRFAFFTAGRNGQAFLNDFVWTVAQLAAFALLISGGTTGIVALVLAWGGSAALAAVVGVFQAGLRPRPLLARSWIRSHRDLGYRYVAENLSLSGEHQLRASGIGAIAGLQTVGSLRAAELLLGPLNVIHFGVELAAVPHAVRVVRGSTRRLLHGCLIVGYGLAGAMLLWGCMLLLLPDRVGSAILGSSWSAVNGLLLPMTLSTACSGMTAGASVGLRALAAARRSLPTRLAASAVRLAGVLAGAAAAGAVGAAWGLASGSGIATSLWWWQFRRGLREYAEPGDRVQDRVGGGLDARR
jgi:O-antigen/teichoic acid export membrane protein